MEDGEGICVYITWDTFRGPLAWSVRIFVGGLFVGRFRDYAGDLELFAEMTAENWT